MAKETVTHITDDLDGSKDAQTVSFALEGVEYSIDLSNKNLKKLRDSLAPFIAAGEKVSRARRQSRRGTSSSSKSRSAEIRAWGRDNGYEVPARGRVPQAVVDAYDAAN